MQVRQLGLFFLALILAGVAMINASSAAGIIL